MTTLDPEKLWAIPRVGPPQALPDGRVLVPVTVHTEDENSETQLWRVDPHSGDRTLFATGAISGLTVSPEHGHVAYLKKTDDYRQVFYQSLDGGDAIAAADLPLGAIGVKWTPDGNMLALAVLWAHHPTLEDTAAHEPSRDVTAHVTENAVYRYWDMWLEHVYHPVHIDVGTGNVTDLTPGATRFWSWPNTDDTIADLDISPDGRMVTFVADDSSPPHRQLSWSLFLMNIDGTDLRRLDSGLDGHSRRPRFTSDGSAIIYGYQADPQFYACHVQLTRYDLESGESSELAVGWDRSAQGWTHDGQQRLLFTAEDQGRQRLYRLSSFDGAVESLTSGGWVSSPTVSADGTVHLLAQSLTAPPEVHRLGNPDAEGIHELVRLTDFTADALVGTEMGTVRELAVAGANDEPVQVWLVDPPGARTDDRLPLVHMIHGGPHGVFGDTWHWRWNAQTVAGAGYRVAHVNFHGSTGWGNDFAATIHGAWGDLPYRDIEAVTDHLIGIGLADEERMAVTGGSYGGYLAAWITSQTHRYRCAVAHAAVTNLGGMYASDLTYGRQLSYGAEIWDDLDAVQRWSPSAQASGYSTPTLVIHGAQDQRVPLTQGLELYGVLSAKGVPARLVSYPEENHWILKRGNSIHWYLQVLDWLNRWMPPD